MNYIEKRVVYYTSIVARLLGKPCEEAFEKTAPIFHQEENSFLREVFNSQTFKRLESSRAVDMHINFVQSFKNDSEFGASSAEFETLFVKRDAERLVEEISKNATATPVNTLFQLQKQKETCTPLIAVLLYNQGCCNSNIFAMLRKALKNGDVDAGLILLYLSKQEQYPVLCAELTKIGEYNLYPELSAMLETYYATDKLVLTKGDV